MIRPIQKLQKSAITRPRDHHGSADADPASAPPGESSCHVAAPFVRACSAGSVAEPMRPRPGARVRLQQGLELGRRVHVREPAPGGGRRRRRRARRARRGSRAVRPRAPARARAGRCGGRRPEAARSAGRPRRGRPRRARAGRAPRAAGSRPGARATSSVGAARSPATRPAIGARTPIPSSRTGNGSPPAFACLPSAIRSLADLAEQPPRALGERLVAEARERLRRAEAPALAADEQHAGQPLS